MNERYMLEIYNPESVEDVWVSFESDSPFLAISKGDLMNPGMFPEASGQKLLRVMSVEHILWSLESGKPKHKLCVYTREVTNDANSRF